MFLYAFSFFVFAAVAVAAFTTLQSNLITFINVFAGVEKAIDTLLQTFKGTL